LLRKKRWWAVWKLNAAFGAPAIPQVKGQIVVSHGTGGSEFGHHQLAARLAQDGYLVAALRHPRDNWQDRSLIGTAQYFMERPAQVTRVLDAILTDEAWRERIPSDRIGAVGHSAGGYTVLALAGGQAAPGRAMAHCRSVQDDPGFCALAKRPNTPATTGSSEAASASSAKLSPPMMAMPSVRDERIRAVVAMAPMAVVLTPESLAQVKPPVKVYVAEADPVLNGKYHGGYAAAAVPHAEQVKVPGAGHFAFMSKPMTDVKADAGDPAFDPEGFDRGAYLTVLGFTFPSSPKP
jgi:predicted dienelactone hydrolase